MRKLPSFVLKTISKEDHRVRRASQPVEEATPPVRGNKVWGAARLPDDKCVFCHATFKLSKRKRTLLGDCVAEDNRAGLLKLLHLASSEIPPDASLCGKCTNVCQLVQQLGHVNARLVADDGYLCVPPKGARQSVRELPLGDAALVSSACTVLRATAKMNKLIQRLHRRFKNKTMFERSGATGRRKSALREFDELMKKDDDVRNLLANVVMRRCVREATDNVRHAGNNKPMSVFRKSTDVLKSGGTTKVIGELVLALKEENPTLDIILRGVSDAQGEGARKGQRNRVLEEYGSKRKQRQDNAVIFAVSILYKASWNELCTFQKHLTVMLQGAGTSGKGINVLKEFSAAIDAGHAQKLVDKEVKRNGNSACAVLAESQAGLQRVVLAERADLLQEVLRLQRTFRARRANGQRAREKKRGPECSLSAQPQLKATKRNQVCVIRFVHAQSRARVCVCV